MELGIEKYAAGPKKERTELRASDLDLWKKWQESDQHPDHLRPLFDSFRGMIRQKANKWANNVEMPPAAIHAEFNKQFVKALQTYDPDKGAALGSWVSTNLQKAQRWITARQNTARIPENRVYKIGQYESGKSHLDNQLGREPTARELSEHLGWTEREVGHMAKQLRRSNISSAWEHDPMEIMPSAETEKLKLVKYEISPEELIVYEHTIGDGGKEVLKPSQIASKYGFSPSKVTRLRQSILQKIQKY